MNDSEIIEFVGKMNEELAEDMRKNPEIWKMLAESYKK